MTNVLDSQNSREAIIQNLRLNSQCSISPQVIIIR